MNLNSSLSIKTLIFLCFRWFTLWGAVNNKTVWGRGPLNRDEGLHQALEPQLAEPWFYGFSELIQWLRRYFADSADKHSGQASCFQVVVILTFESFVFLWLCEGNGSSLRGSPCGSAVPQRHLQVLRSPAGGADDLWLQLSWTPSVNIGSSGRNQSHHIGCSPDADSDTDDFSLNPQESLLITLIKCFSWGGLKLCFLFIGVFNCINAESADYLPVLYPSVVFLNSVCFCRVYYFSCSHIESFSSFNCKHLFLFFISKYFPNRNIWKPSAVFFKTCISCCSSVFIFFC